MDISVDISVQKEQVHADVRYQAEVIKAEMDAKAGINSEECFISFTVNLILKHKCMLRLSSLISKPFVLMQAMLLRMIYVFKWT